MKKGFLNLGFNKINWTILLLNIGFSFYFLFTDTISVWSICGLVASITNITAVILIANKDIRNYPLAIIAVIGYGIVSYRAGNTGEWLLCIYYVVMNIFGWYWWYKAIKSGENKDDTVVCTKRFNTKQFILCMAILVVSVVAFAQALQNDTVQMFLYKKVFEHHIHKYYIDSFTNVASIIAMFLFVRRYMEQWYIWIIVNIVSIVLWCITFDAIMIVMWASLLANSVYGLIQWKKLN